MQSGQVSVWVPIVVGVIGLAGVVAGQLLNAWRERKREEVKWRRERHTESVKLAHDNAGRWREIRIDVYTQFLDSLTGLVREGAMFDRDRRGGEIGPVQRAEQYDRYSELRKLALVLEQKVLLVCSPTLYAMMKKNDPLHLLAGPAFNFADAENWEVLFSAGGLLLFHQGFLLEARSELGIELPGLSDPV